MYIEGSDPSERTKLTNLYPPSISSRINPIRGYQINQQIFFFNIKTARSARAIFAERN